MSLVDDALKALPPHSTPEIGAAHDHYTQMRNLPALHRQRLAEATAAGDVQAVAELKVFEGSLHPVQEVAAALALLGLQEAHYDASISQMTDHLAGLQPALAAARLAVKDAETVLEAAEAALADGESAAGMVSSAIRAKEAQKRNVIAERKEIQAAALRT